MWTLREKWRTVNPGSKFGRLIVLGHQFKFYAKDRHNWCCVCLCECGNVKVAEVAGLYQGRIQSCKCFQRERLRESLEASIYRGHPAYAVWGAMIQRCCNPNHKSYHRYGGRGIAVCEEWKNDNVSFVEWAFKNGWRIGLSIERIDNDGNYEPSNCRFATRKDQQRNRSVNAIYELDGEAKCLAAWSEDPRCQPTKGGLRSRLVRGWDFKEALLTP
jgi:hypothetical protein